MDAAIDRLRGFAATTSGRARDVSTTSSTSTRSATSWRRIGCKPTLSAIRRESLRFRVRFFAGPYVAAQYRLIGPHAKPTIARQVIAGLPIAQPRYALALFYLRWRLSRVFSPAARAGVRDEARASLARIAALAQASGYGANASAFRDRHRDLPRARARELENRRVRRDTTVAGPLRTT
jgi:hypothetical protein